jgi:hypothetical protein
MISAGNEVAQKRCGVTVVGTENDGRHLQSGPGASALSQGLLLFKAAAQDLGPPKTLDQMLLTTSPRPHTTIVLHHLRYMFRSSW